MATNANTTSVTTNVNTTSMTEPLDLRALRKHQRRVVALLNLDQAFRRFGRKAFHYQKRELPLSEYHHLKSSTQDRGHVTWKDKDDVISLKTSRSLDGTEIDDGYDSQSDCTKYSGSFSDRSWKVDKSRSTQPMRGLFMKIPSKSSSVRRRRGWLSMEEDKQVLSLSDERLKHAVNASLDSSLNMISEELERSPGNYGRDYAEERERSPGNYGNYGNTDRGVDGTILQRRDKFGRRSKGMPLPPIVAGVLADDVTSDFASDVASSGYYDVGSGLPDRYGDTIRGNGDVSAYNDTNAHLKYRHRFDDGRNDDVTVYERDLSGLLSRDRTTSSFKDSPLYIRSYDSRETSGEMERCSACSDDSTGMCERHKQQQSRHRNSARVTPSKHRESKSGARNDSRSKTLRTPTGSPHQKLTLNEHLYNKDILEVTEDNEDDTEIIIPDLDLDVAEKDDSKSETDTVPIDVDRKAYLAALAEATKRKFYEQRWIVGLRTSRAYVYSFYEAIGHPRNCPCISCKLYPKPKRLPPIIPKSKAKDPSKILFGDVRIDDYYAKS